VKRGKSAKHFARVIIPDSHGEHIDLAARDAFIRDLAQIQPREIVMLGDHLDAGGTFNAHQRSYTNELTESYDADVIACNEFLDLVQDAAPNAQIHYIEGNHEGHVERWVARSFTSHRDASRVIGAIGPAAVLRLQARGVSYYTRSAHYMGLSIPGAIKLGKCFFVHGISHAKNADDEHLKRFGHNVVFGHVHRSMSVVERTVMSDGHGAWCPGTLAKLQPLYAHTRPTSWSHGYGIQFTNESTGRFSHWNVPIMGGTSMLRETVDALSGGR
jgi:metallophosphoesterase superfamily enzyme